MQMGMHIQIECPLAAAAAAAGTGDLLTRAVCHDRACCCCCSFLLVSLYPSVAGLSFCFCSARALAA